MSKENLWFQARVFLFLLLFIQSCLIIWTRPSLAWGGASSSSTSDQLRQINDQLRQAHEYYRRGEYDLAAGSYLDLIHRGYQDAAIFYNLGNAYFKKGELGWAILFYEKARRLLPRDEDIRENLTYAHSLTIDKIESKPSELLSLVDKAINFLSPNELTVAAASIYLILIVIGMLIIWKKEHPVRKRLLCLLAIFATIFILAAGVLFYRIWELEVAQIGVITAKVVEVKSGPEENLATLFSLHEGTTFSIQQQRGDWLQIAIKNGLNGWVQSKDIQKISF
ncbi:MAG: tetratricopeptide repeat protein [bacterium]|nr:tetratricopeptide repeat protein [bacterium]